MFKVINKFLKIDRVTEFKAVTFNFFKNIV